MRYTSLLLSFAIFNLMFGQTVSLKTTLDSSIKESSGIIKLNDRLITFNDSQGLPQLYEFDGVTGEVTRSVTLSNAKNTDWEDICIDNDYIYIGDFGNNLGSRTDLKIYKISIQDYLTSDTVSADSILFSYPEQIDFSSEPYSTNFDAEALLSYGDSLYIFTKNWGDYKSNIYALPKTSGDYSAHKVGNFNAGVLITGADYNIEKNCVILCGYFFSSDFILEITDFTSPNLSEENITRYNITPPEGTSYQIEGICYVEENKYYLTSEEFQGKSAAFIEVEMLESSTKRRMNKDELIIYPNPFSNKVEIVAKDFHTADIYNIKGQLLKSSTDRVINLEMFKNQTFLVQIKNSKGQVIGIEKIIKE